MADTAPLCVLVWYKLNVKICGIFSSLCLKNTKTNTLVYQQQNLSIQCSRRRQQKTGQVSGTERFMAETILYNVFIQKSGAAQLKVFEGNNEKLTVFFTVNLDWS